jgi:hypothetical protein
VWFLKDRALASASVKTEIMTSHMPIVTQKLAANFAFLCMASSNKAFASKVQLSKATLPAFSLSTT